MLVKANRLTKQSDFKKIFNQGGKSFGNFFRLRVKANGLAHSRFAVVASGKVSKKATARNRVKRQTREIIRLNLARLNGNYDVIINIMSSALEQKYEILEKGLLAELKNLKILKNV